MDRRTTEYLETRLKDCGLLENEAVLKRDILEQETVEVYLVTLAQQGDEIVIEYIFKKYRALVFNRAKTYFIAGADKEDLVQEGMIGLHKAIRDFDKDKNILFRYFAELCVNRQLITAVKGSTRQKHIPLNSYISLNKPVFEEDSETTLMDLVANDVFSDPEEIILHKEKSEIVKKMIEELLTPLEKKVITMYLQGVSYQETATILGYNIKTIDNALQRSKRKFERYLSEGYLTDENKD